jgi:hypothetical protein
VLVVAFCSYFKYFHCRFPCARYLCYSEKTESKSEQEETAHELGQPKALEQFRSESLEEAPAAPTETRTHKRAPNLKLLGRVGRMFFKAGSRYLTTQSNP